MAYIVKSFCRNCSALCSMNVTVEDNQLLAISADGTASPYGAYMCIKGQSSMDFHNGSENRLLHSLKRDADGQLRPLTTTAALNTALDEIATQISALIATYGPRAVALYHGTGAYRSVLGAQLEKSFLAAIASPNLFSTMTIDQSAKWVTSGRMGTMASGKPALVDVDLALLVGNNPLVSHQTYPFSAGESGAPGRAYAAAKKRGMRMIVIDPRRTETARYADLFIQPLPGHDAAIFAAIAHVLLRDVTYNRDFCSRFVDQIEVLRAAVAVFTPEFAAARADVPVAQIELAAQWLGEAQRPFVGSGSGPSMSANSNLNDHMIEVVNALVDGYRRAGDQVRNPGTLNPRQFFEMAVPPERSWERGDKCRTADIGKLFGEFPTALLPQEILTPGPDKIRALIVFGGNPLMGLGDPARAIPAFDDLDLLVCLDPRLNETGDYAHYVIATSQAFERHDITLAGDSLYPEAFAQYAPPIITKPDAVIDDWEFFWEIARRMGKQLTLKYWRYGLEFDAIKDGLPLPLDTKPNAETMLRFLCKNSSVSFDELKENPSGVRPMLEPQYVQATPPGKHGRLQLCPADVAAELLQLHLQPSPLLADNGAVIFSYQLTSRRILEAMNGAYRDAERTRKKYPVNWVYMNPDDMQREGLTDGVAVELQSEVGCVNGIVKTDVSLRSGVISMTHLFGQLQARVFADESTAAAVQRQGGSFTGRLTSLEKYLEPINFMPRFSGVPVNVRLAHSV